MSRNPFYTPTPTEPELPRLNLFPTDLLPQKATLDAEYRPEWGMFATRQPSLAARYGVVRNGELVSPDALQGTPPQEAPPAPPPVEAPPKEVEGFLRGAEAPAPPPPEPPGPKFSGEAPMMDPLDLAHLREQVLDGALRDNATRALIESRLKGEPFDYSAFLLEQPFQQTVVIAPGKLEITFEVMPYAVENLAKQLIAEEAKGVVDEYLMDKFFLYGVAAAVRRINNLSYPSVIGPDGALSRTAVVARLDWLMKRPFPLVSLLSIQYSWFCDRMYRALRAIDPKAG